MHSTEQEVRNDGTSLVSSEKYCGSALGPDALVKTEGTSGAVVIVHCDLREAKPEDTLVLG